MESGTTLVAVEVLTENDSVRPGTQVELPVQGLQHQSDYEVSQDGQQFLFAFENPESRAAGITVVHNWFELLKRPE